MYLHLGTINTLVDLHKILEMIIHCDKLKCDGDYDDTNLHIYDAKTGEELAYIKPVWRGMEDEGEPPQTVIYCNEIDKLNEYLELTYGSQIR